MRWLTAVVAILLVSQAQCGGPDKKSQLQPSEGGVADGSANNAPKTQSQIQKQQQSDSQGLTIEPIDLSKVKSSAAASGILDASCKEVFETKERGAEGILPMLVTMAYYKFDEADKFATYFENFQVPEAARAAEQAEVQDVFKKDSEKLTELGVAVQYSNYRDNSQPGMAFASKCVDKLCEIFIAFRGTRSSEDKFTNFKMWQAGSIAFPKDTKIPADAYQKLTDCKVHAGYLGLYNDLLVGPVRAGIDRIRKENPDAKLRIRVGGHSMGGALALISAVHMLLMDLPLAVNGLQLETYGCPLVSNPQLSSFLSSQLGEKNNVMRFVNVLNSERDKVPSLPFESFLRIIQYQHVGPECVLTPAGKRIQSVKYGPHRIEGYRAAYEQQHVCGGSPTTPSSSGSPATPPTSETSPGSGRGSGSGGGADKGKTRKSKLDSFFPPQ